MGILHEVRMLFGNSALKYIPNFMVGIVCYVVFSSAPFRPVHGRNNAVIMRSTGTGPQNLTLLSDLLCHTPTFSVVHMPTLQLAQVQLEKLVTNAIINPLTVILNCNHRQLFKDSHIRDVISKLTDLLLQEICKVL